MDSNYTLERQIEYRDHRIAELVAEVLELREFKQQNQKSISHEKCHENSSYLRARLATAEKEADRAISKIESMQRNFAFVHPDLGAAQARGDKLLNEKASIRHKYSTALGELRQEKARNCEAESNLRDDYHRLHAQYELLHIKHTKLLEDTTDIPAIPCTYTNYIVIDSTLSDYQPPACIITLLAWATWFLLILGQIFSLARRFSHATTVYIFSALGQLVVWVCRSIFSYAAKVASPSRIRGFNMACCDTVAVIVAGTIIGVGNVVDTLPSIQSEMLVNTLFANRRTITLLALNTILVWAVMQYGVLTVIKRALDISIGRSIIIVTSLYKSAFQKMNISCITQKAHFLHLLEHIIEATSQLQNIIAGRILYLADEAYKSTYNFKRPVEDYVLEVYHYGSMQGIDALRKVYQALASTSSAWSTILHYSLQIYYNGRVCRARLLYVLHQVLSRLSNLTEQYDLVPHHQDLLHRVQETIEKLVNGGKDLAGELIRRI